MRHAIALAKVLAVSTLFVLGGCSAPVAPEQGDPVFAADVARDRQAAAAAGASQAQLDILDRAAEQGQVSLALAKEAQQNFFACLSDHGVGYLDDGQGTVGEFPRLHYSIYGFDTTQADLCYSLEFDWVDGLYQTQSPREADIAAFIMEHQDQAIECLRQGGIPVENQPTFDQLHGALHFGAFGWYPGDDPRLADQSHLTVDCYTPLGLDLNDATVYPGSARPE